MVLPTKVFKSAFTGPQVEERLAKADLALQASNVIDNLASTEVDRPLSANQGRVLDEVTVKIADVVNALDSIEAAKPLSAAQGKVLQDSKAPMVRNLVAGVGLVGGGDLSADRTFDLNGVVLASLSLADSALQAGAPASAIAYNNLTSGLTATQIQAAIDELDAAIEGIVAGAVSAAATSFDPTTSGLAATNVQAAIDEVDGDVDAIAADYYRKNNIVGTVSESAGVPTGAIIEAGSNANGNYTYFADGTLITQRNVTYNNITTPAGAVYRSEDFAFAQPATFVTYSPHVYAADSSASTIWINARSDTLMAYFTTSLASTRSARVTSIGRWY